MDFLLKHKKWILMAGTALVLFSVLAFVWINAGTQTAVIWVDDQTQPIKVQTNANTAAAILVSGTYSLCCRGPHPDQLATQLHRIKSFLIYRRL